MPEQGPTEAEVTLIFGGPKPKSMDCQCSGSSVQCRAHQWRAAEAVALKLDALTRARHVREAVEGLPKSQRGGVKVPGFWSDGEGMVCDPEHLIIALTKEIVS